jgi:glycosyltransferase involved in cell wall biosynthesis
MTRIYILDQSALSIGGHNFGYSACIAEAARLMRFDVVLLTNVRLSERFPEDEGIRVLPIFTWGEAGRETKTSWQTGNMAYEMVKAFGAVPPSAEDHVLLHTIWSDELRAILSYFVACVPTMDMPHYHILLRFDPSEMGPNLGLCFPYFRQVRTSPVLSRRIHFHSDTQLLSRVYERLLGVSVATAPIPFPRMKVGSSAVRKTSRTRHTPLRAVYLGVARAEKGFHYLPGAVAYLWQCYLATHRLELVVQSQIRTSDEPGILEACQQLTMVPGNSVKLVPSPLSTGQYVNLLRDCDIVILPYHPGSYRLRSSGVLVEALALGKVVVTSSGSWMSTQVTREHAVLFSHPDELGPAIGEAVDRFDALHAGALARREYWWTWSSGDHFVHHILDVAERSSKLVGMHPPRILFVMDSATLGRQGDIGHIANAQLTYLSAAGYRIAGLFLCRDSHNGPASHDDGWSQALLDHAVRYPFERLFIAGPQQSAYYINRTQPSAVSEPLSVRHEIEAACRFTFSGEIHRFVRNNRIDAAVLNSITDVPVLDVLGLSGTPAVCTIRELMSFSKAVQERRLVEECDVDDEMAALAQCDVLLSPGELDAEYIRARLPRVKVVDPGVFLGSPISSLHTLAGANNLAEIVNSCQSENPDYQLKSPSIFPSNGGIFPLLDLDAIDLLYVGREDASDLSDLRWFLQEVYLPYLDGFGISLAVAGEICNASTWPTARRLFLLGQVQDARPLYAAARIAVWPVLHDAGRWMRNLEALRYACPVIATRAAVRGIEGKTQGMLIRDDAASFAAAIVNLVSSPAERRKYAEVSASVYLRVCDPARYLHTMNEVFATVLGHRARPAPAFPIQSTEVASRTEWSSLVRAINNFVRAVIQGDAVSREWLACIAASPTKETDQILAGVCQSLFDKRDAPILASEPWLGELICAGPEPITYHDLSYALQIALSDFGFPTRDQSSDPLILLANSGLALGVRALTATIEGANAASIRANGNVVATRRGATGMPGLVCAVIPAARSGIARLRVLELSFGVSTNQPWPPCVVLAQQIPLSPDVSVFGHRVFHDGWRFSRERRGATIQNCGIGTLQVPRVIAGLGTEFIDLLCDGPQCAISRLVVKVAGEIANTRRWSSRRYTGLRVLLTRPVVAGDFGYVQVTIENADPADGVEVVEILVGTMIGDLSDGHRILSLPWGVFDQRPLASSDGGDALWQSALKQVVAGRAVNPIDLRNLAQMGVRRMRPTAIASDGRPMKVPSVDAEIASSHMATENLLALVYPRRVKDIRQSMIVSPALTVEGIDRKGAVRGRRNGTTAGLAGRSWLLHRRDLVEAGQFRITLPALEDPATGHVAVELRGFYQKEKDSSGPPFRWTGPHPNAEIILPIALIWSAQLDVIIADLGLNRRAADLSVLQDEVPIGHELVLENIGRARLRAVLRPKEIARGTLVLGITTRRMHRSERVDRRQGIAIEKLELTMEIPRDVLMPGKEGLVSRVRGWVTPPRIVIRRLIAHGNRARDQRDWPTAAAWYRKALETDPGLAAIWVQLGHALKEQGDLAGGAEAYRQSLKLADAIADTHLQLGHVLKLQGRMSEAAEAYFRALLLDNGFAHARLELEALGYSRSRIDEALAAGDLSPR